MNDLPRDRLDVLLAATGWGIIKIEQIREGEFLWRIERKLREQLATPGY